jgi:hypothetical protein
MRKFRENTGVAGNREEIQRARTSLVNSGMQTENNANFQVSNQLITAVGANQAVIEQKVSKTDIIPAKQISGLPFTNSNVYIPVLTNVANISASAAFFTYWRRYNNQIEVWGKVTIDPIANNTLTELEMSLPQPGIFQHAEQCSGTANGVPFSGSTVNFAGIVSANPITGNAVIRFYSTNTVDNDVRFIFTYLYIPKQ